MDHDRAIDNLAVESYLLGEMTPGEREEFEQHFFDCPDCAQEVREAMRFMSDTKVMLGSEPSPAGVSQAHAKQAERSARKPASGERPKWFAWLQPQAAVAAIGVLAAICVVESVAIPSLRQRLNDKAAPKVVSATFLRPQTRGSAKALRAEPGQPVILMFDAPESSSGNLRYVLQSADGKSVFALTATAPAAGEPVTLSIPKLDLPGGTYNLIVESAAGAGQAGQELEKYPFELQRP